MYSVSVFIRYNKRRIQITDDLRFTLFTENSHSCQKFVYLKFLVISVKSVYYALLLNNFFLQAKLSN